LNLLKNGDFGNNTPADARGRELTANWTSQAQPPEMPVCRHRIVHATAIFDSYQAYRSFLIIFGTF
jgi:hypothetical protein